MLTISQQIRLCWFQLRYSNRVRNREYMRDVFRNYNRDPELFYAINKFALTFTNSNPEFIKYVLPSYADYYGQYPLLQSTIERLINEYIKSGRPSNFDICQYIERFLLERHIKPVFMIIDAIKNNQITLDYLIRETRFMKINQGVIYEYMVNCGADYRLINDHDIRVRIEKTIILFRRFCLLVKILKNVPNELIDVRKLTYDIGQFISNKQVHDNYNTGIFTTFGMQDAKHDIIFGKENLYQQLKNLKKI